MFTNETENKKTNDHAQELKDANSNMMLMLIVISAFETISKALAKDWKSWK